MIKKLILLCILSFSTLSIYALKLANASDDDISWHVTNINTQETFKESTHAHDTKEIHKVPAITMPHAVTITFTGTEETCEYEVDQETLKKMPAVHAIRFETNTQFSGIPTLVVKSKKSEIRLSPDAVTGKQERMLRYKAEFDERQKNGTRSRSDSDEYPSLQEERKEQLPPIKPASRPTPAKTSAKYTTGGGATLD
jgi:hypothetical protein